MYEYIQGEITELTPAYAVVEAGSVGYMMIISLNTYSIIEKQPRAKLYTHFAVREDAHVLYGFADRHERELFRMLIGVSGVGGNTARMILSTYAPDELANIIATENATLLKNVKGLGIKTAQKIIVDLRDKMAGAALSAGMPAVSGGNGSECYDEAVAALSMLGFPKAASDKAVRTVMKDSPGAPVEEVIRMSLKRL